MSGSGEELGTAMKAGMRHLASGVAVVATCDENDVPKGMTVTSITSVSDQPASLLISLHLDSQTYQALTVNGEFSVNLLCSDQEAISRRCAFTPDDQNRFALGDWRTREVNTIPYLADGLASFFCRVSREINYGTHSIIIGDIGEVVLGRENAAPLVYCRGDYYRLPTE